MATHTRLRIVAVFGVGLIAASIATPANAARRTIARSNTTPIVIPTVGEASPYPSTISIGARRTRIVDVNVTLHGLTHSAPDDIDVLLVAPNGRRASIMSDVGGKADADNVTLTLDDEAASPLPDEGPLVTGTFRPTDAEPEFPAPAPSSSALSVFDGARPTGEWQLFVVDDDNPNDGQIAGGWTLELRVRTL